jgi:hypothetical protein
MENSFYDVSTKKGMEFIKEALHFFIFGMI